MVIEFDPAKEAANQRKHGLSLRRLADMDHDQSISIPSPRRGEDRTIIVG